MFNYSEKNMQNDVKYFFLFLRRAIHLATHFKALYASNLYVVSSKCLSFYFIFPLLKYITTFRSD